MVWIPGGEFTMGTDEEASYRPERPAHLVQVDGFWMDITEVTNAQFRQFVNATGYVTVAERKPDWEDLRHQLPPGTPKPSDDKLVPGALVFIATAATDSPNKVVNWWRWTPDASWRHPIGPGSDIDRHDSDPVVQVCWDDAVAYAKWAGKRLPTEAEWEFAARGGLDRKRYAWGDDFAPSGKFMANTWQGRFPDANSAEDGFAGIAPVKSYPANDYGLFDMIGNVWEWCSDWYDADQYVHDAQLGTVVNPEGPAQSVDPSEPYSSKRVTRGGSFLCGADSCLNFRPSARQASSPDTGMSHIGFRCVATPNMLQQKPPSQASAPGR